MACMTWIHDMQKETKPTAIKKNKHMNEKQKLDDYSGAKKIVFLMDSEHKT